MSKKPYNPEQKPVRFTISLDQETRRKLEDHRERILRDFGMDVSLSEAAASFVRKGVYEVDSKANNR